VPKNELTRPEAAYLGEFYRLLETSVEPTVSTLAQRFGVSLPTVIDVFERLERKGLVLREPWKTPKLTRQGMALAASIIHRHRVIELYFSEKLGLGYEFSCSEASKIDYLLSDEVVSRMCSALHRPRRCFHGNPVKHVGCMR